MPISPQITVTPTDITTKIFDITSVSYTTTTATFTATGHTLSVGDVVIISEIAPDGYNGTFTITATATNTFTVANTVNSPVTFPTGQVFWANATDFTYQDTATNYSLTAVDQADIIETVTADVSILIDGKIRAYYQTTAPASGMNSGDLWFDTDDGNKLYIYNAGSWTSVQDTAIAAAASAATAAQSTADGKNKIFRQGSTPTGTFATGDLWFDSANGDRISRWSGSAWVQYGLGYQAISSIDAGTITVGTLSAARIAAGSLDASKIAAGTITATQISSSYVYAGTIAAGSITAGTLTGFTIQTNSGSNAVVVDGSNNGIGFRSSGSYAGWVSNVSTAGVLINYGGSPDVNGYPQARTTSSSATIAGSGSSSFSSNSSGTNTVTGSTTFSGSTTFNATATFTSSSSFNSGITVSSSASLPTTSCSGELSASFGASNTVANAANTWMSTSGQLRRVVSSSQEYKENIVNLTSIPEYDPTRLYELPVRAFTYKDEYLTEENDFSGVLMPGFIAEEVDSIYPVATDYENGKPESWNTRILLAAMLSLIQQQNTRINALEARG